MYALIVRLLGSRPVASMGMVGMLALATACSKPELPARYTTRGAVRGDDGTGDDRRIAVHHEAIAAFRDREGQVAPMPSMPMAFALAPSITTPPLAPGTKLQLEFEVRWQSSPPLTITRLEVLAPNTPLALSDDH